MSIELLEMVKHISEAQLEAIRSRDLHALTVLQLSRQDLMLTMERQGRSAESAALQRIQGLLEEIYENEALIMEECRSASLDSLDLAWN